MELISVPQMAEMLGISRIAVFNKIKNGKLKAMKAGRNYVIEKGYAEEYAREYKASHGLSEGQKALIDRVVHRAMTDFGDSFKRLAKE
jgi:excisionase family DNA binding protein